MASTLAFFFIDLHTQKQIVINMPPFRCQCDTIECQKISNLKIIRTIGYIKRITLTLGKSFLKKSFFVTKKIFFLFEI